MTSEAKGRVRSHLLYADKTRDGHPHRSEVAVFSLGSEPLTPL